MKYIVIDETKFKKGSLVRQMIEDIHKIIIEEDLIGENITIHKINQMLKDTKYITMSLNEIRTTIWSVITRDKKLITCNNVPQGTLVYWKDHNTPKICLSR